MAKIGEKIFDYLFGTGGKENQDSESPVLNVTDRTLVESLSVF